MVNKDTVARNIDYLKFNDGTYHEVYIAIIVCDVMNVPLEWVDNEKLNKISSYIEEALESDKGIFNEEFRQKVMNIEKEIEREKISYYKDEQEEIEN